MTGSHFDNGQGALVAAVLFAILGVVLVIQGLLTGSRAQDSLTWPQVEGRITQSHLVEEKDRHSGDMVHRPVITYQYTADDGSTNTGSRIDFNPRKIHGAEALALTDRYPTGMTVTVYMHPTDPTISALTQGTGPGTWFSLKAGLAIITLGFLCLGVYLKKEKVAPEKKSNHSD